MKSRNEMTEVRLVLHCRATRAAISHRQELLDLKTDITFRERWCSCRNGLVVGEIQVDMGSSG